MRRYIVILVLLVMMIFQFGCSDVIESDADFSEGSNSVNISDNESEDILDENLIKTDDSMRISDEILSLVRESDGEKVIKIFSGVYFDDFAEKLSIDQIIKDKRTLYVIVDDDGKATTKYNIEDGVIRNVSYPSNREAYLIKHLYDTAINYERLFADNHRDIEIMGTYCLETGIMTLEQQVIFFATNHGDFVYYVEHSGKNINEYIFEYTEFCQISKEFQTDLAEYNHYYPGIVGTITYSDFCDLTEYNLKEYEYGEFETLTEIFNSGVELTACQKHYFYEAIGKWYIAVIDADENIIKIKQYDKFEVENADFSQIKSGMTVWEVVDIFGLPSRSPLAKGTKDLIFEDNKGNYAEVCFDSDMNVDQVVIKSYRDYE